MRVRPVLRARCAFVLAVSVAALLPRAAAAQDGSAPPPPAPSAAEEAPRPETPPAWTTPSSWIVLPPADVRGRRSLRTDAVFGRHLLARDSAPPKLGDEVTGDTGKPVKWVAGTMTPAGELQGTLDGGPLQYAYTSIDVPAETIALAQVTGAATLWVNGDPVVGDPYGYGHLGAPVLLKAGENRLYLSGLLSKVRVRLIPTQPGIRVENWDVTKPDAVRGAPLAAPCGLVVMNASTTPAWGLALTTDDEPPTDFVNSLRKEFSLPPLWLTKVAVGISLPAVIDPEKRLERIPVRVVLHGTDFSAATEIPIVVRDEGPARRITFVSGIDESVQEFAYLAASPGDVPGGRSLVLSLHGASVDSHNQAKSYSARPEFALVAPTNRRPYGFDWQDWGRLDAYEVLDEALRLTRIDPRRVHLTGHSMGGHGTWHLAANDPDRFCSIAPSAGWISFDTYGGGRPKSALSPLWNGADLATDTLGLLPNLVQIPAFVVHGTADETVPAAQAQQMIDALSAAGAKPGVLLHEGGKHWWDGDAAPGADCVDHPAIFDLFAKNPPRPAPASFTWVVADPVIDSSHHWLSLTQPLEYGKPVTIHAANDAGNVTLTTTNAGWIGVDSPGGVRAKTIVLDGQAFAPTRTPSWFRRGADGWLEVGARGSATEKAPLRSGPFKRAFARRFLMVLPTKGTPEENAEALARARFDAQQWWYRGNGMADVVMDTQFISASSRDAGRNVILYGNADTNAAWTKVLGESCPIVLRRGSAKVGKQSFQGDGIAAMFVRPRADDRLGIVGVFGDTGVRGARAGFLHLAISSGTGYPDFTVWNDTVPVKGDGAVLSAGWFRADWTLAE